MTHPQGTKPMARRVWSRQRALLVGLAGAFVALVVACGGTATQNPETFTIKSGKSETRKIKFEKGAKAEITVTSEEDSDIDLFVYDEKNNLVTKDDGDSKDCHVSF